MDVHTTNRELSQWSLSCEANRLSASQAIPRILFNPKFDITDAYTVQKTSFCLKCISYILRQILEVWNTKTAMLAFHTYLGL
jgi:hypothetical protein